MNIFEWPELFNKAKKEMVDQMQDFADTQKYEEPEDLRIYGEWMQKFVDLVKHTKPKDFF